jgi:hypothetical protein
VATSNPEEELLAGDVQVVDPGPDSILGPGHDYRTVTDRIAGVVYLPFKRSPKKWLVGAFIAFCFVNLLMFATSLLFFRGIGIWGVNIPIGWGFAIINFVWWIGIGHAGTLI